MDLHTELQALADQIKARHAHVQPQQPARRPAPATPAAPYFSSAYRCCSLCGSERHADGRCYPGGAL